MRTALLVAAGTECYVWIVGYDAPDVTPYTVDLWMESNSQAGLRGSASIR